MIMTIAEGRRATEQKSEKCAPICHMRDGVHCIYVITITITIMPQYQIFSNES